MINAKAIAKRIIPIWLWRQVKYNIFNGYVLKSYSQEGEDVLLRCFFKDKQFGFYVDVGAHHPKRFSNTFHFYKKGWRGINIDAMPGSMVLFNRYRSRDINLEIPVSSQKKMLTYYMFNEPALNGFSKEIADKQNCGDIRYRIIDSIEMETRTLEDIFSEYLPKGQHIDFISIDVEGLDYDVILSNDWQKYKPSVVLVEILGNTLEEILQHDITTYLKKHNYKIFSKAINTVVFKLESF